ncbi:MAG: DUF1574 domain-containing protein, partial [Spirochaetia bacterium]|nr:DUF1574 domain-containing protein [Spirochaetia bacterium]
NFAGPQAVPAYYYFLTEKIFSKRLRPEYLIIGLSPDGFNKNSSYFASPVMSMGVDGRFVEKYKSQILKKDMESYWKTRRYALVGINFSLRTLLKRTFSSIGMDTADKSKEIPVHMFPLVTGFINKSYMGTPERKNEFIKVFLNSPADNLDQYSLQKSPRVKLLKLSDGANYSWFGTMGHTAMKAETKNLVSLYLKFYEVSEVQLYFFRQTLKAANDAGVKVIVFWPRANPYLIEVYKNEPRIYTLWEEIEKISKEEGAVAVDLNSHPGTSCSNFYDASHLSIVCYPGIARTLLEIFEKKQGPG